MLDAGLRFPREGADVPSSTAGSYLLSNSSWCVADLVIRSRRYSCEMRPLRYSINVTLDGCCDHRAILADEDLHRHAAKQEGIGLVEVLDRVTMQVFVRGDCTVIAAPVQRDVDGVSKGTHLASVPPRPDHQIRDRDTAPEVV